MKEESYRFVVTYRTGRGDYANVVNLNQKEFCSTLQTLREAGTIEEDITTFVMVPVKELAEWLDRMNSKIDTILEVMENKK